MGASQLLLGLEAGAVGTRLCDSEPQFPLLEMNAGLAAPCQAPLSFSTDQCLLSALS